jgi:hypothetical protein
MKTLVVSDNASARERQPRLVTSRTLALGLFLLLTGSSAAPAQSTFGDIVGIVQDQTSSLVPGATVTLENVDENATQSTVSDANGAFQFLNLKPGQYAIVVSLAGFADYTLKDIHLEVRQVLRITTRLALADVQESIQVSASALVANTENATLADSKVIADVIALPLNSRAVSTSPLAALATSPSVVKDSQGNIAIGGATSAMVGFSVDGISTANVRQNGALQSAYPSLEGIQEMKVTAFNNNAEFAQVSDVTFTTKSGTQTIHGSLFEYLQNSALDAAIYDFPVKAPKQFNTFGGSWGGPVAIPKVYDRHGTFFFFDYEGNRKNTSTPELLRVPTAAERNGDLSALVAAQGTPLVDPFTGQPYPNNTVPGGPACTNPQDCLNPTALALLKYYPLPNANLNVPNPSYDYHTLAPIPSDSNAWDLRIDQTFTPQQSLYGRLSWKNNAVQQADPFLPNVNMQNQNRSLVVSHNYVKSATWLNEFRFGFTNFNENDGFPIRGSAAIAGLGLQGIDISQHPTGSAFPTFSFSDNAISSIGQNRVGTTISRTIQFTDNLTHIVREHTLNSAWTPA